MPRKLLNKLIPHHNIRNDEKISVFGELLHDRNLWHLNRRSVSVACAIGIFSAFVPIPFQMILAGGLAIIFRCNLPISVALVWITNPITMTPLFYLSYKIGTWLTNSNLGPFEFELTLNWLFTELLGRWRPFLMGCLFMGTISGLLGFLSARVFWRIYVIMGWKKRNKLRKLRKLKKI